MNKVPRMLLTLIMDFTIAAVIVGGDYMYNYGIPRKLPVTGTETVSEYGNADVQGQQGNVSASDSTAADTASSSAGTETAAEQAVPAEWGKKFSSYFTDQVKTTDTSYTSPDISVQIDKRSYGKAKTAVTYYVADIHIASIECLKTEFAKDSYGIGYQDGIVNMSQNVNAVLAINGDSYSNERHKSSGTVIRNGVPYRMDPTKYDVCVMYQNGEMKTYPGSEFDARKAIDDGALQTWIFGPSLLDTDGNVPQEYNTWDYIRETHPRSAIGYYEPGHYCMVLVDGRQTDTGYSRGMTLSELSKVFKDLGCKAAYNLDGGHSSFLTFEGKIASHPYKPKTKISDCIYLAEPQKPKTVAATGGVR